MQTARHFNYTVKVLYVLMPVIHTAQPLRWHSSRWRCIGLGMLWDKVRQSQSPAGGPAACALGGASSTALGTFLQVSKYHGQCLQLLVSSVVIYHVALLFSAPCFVWAGAWLLLEAAVAAQKALGVPVLLNQGWGPAVGKEGGSQLQDCKFPCASWELVVLREHKNVSVILPSPLCLVLHFHMSHIEVGLDVTLGAKRKALTSL